MQTSVHVVERSGPCIRAPPFKSSHRVTATRERPIETTV